MNRRRQLAIAAAAGAVLALAALDFFRSRPELVLTGTVATDDVIVGSEVGGRIQELLVREGDAVKRGQLLARIQPQEWQADLSFYQDSERQAAAQVSQAEADLKFQEAQAQGQIRQAEANLAAIRAQAAAADSDLEEARLSFERESELHRQGTDSQEAYDEARTARDGALARAASQHKQVAAGQAALELARAEAQEVAAKRAALEAGRDQLAAAGAEKEKARVQLGYTDVRAPIDGIVDVRAALRGEVVGPGQAVVTLVDPDDLWVRADVEESYIDRIRLGQKVAVRLPSGAVREGTIFFRGVDADYATQRDVSRTKRDIKTFELRVRCDNRDRALALGMTAYVVLPLKP